MSAGSGHNLISPDVGCEGLLPLRPVGYAADAAVAGLVPVYRCRTGAGDAMLRSRGLVLAGLVGAIAEPANVRST